MYEKLKPICDMFQPPKNWAKKIQDEWRILEKDLPGMHYVSLIKQFIMNGNE